MVYEKVKWNIIVYAIIIHKVVGGEADEVRFAPYGYTYIVQITPNSRRNTGILVLIQPIVCALLFKKLLMTADFGYRAAVKHHDLIRIADG